MSDGRLYGDLDVQTIQCNAADGTCNIPVPGPSVALVFLNDAAYQNSGGDIATPVTFATTTTTHRVIASMDPAALAASNGRSGQDPLGATSKGGSHTSSAVAKMGSFVGAVSIVVGVVVARLLL